MAHSAENGDACDGAPGDPCDGASATAVVSLLGGAAAGDPRAAAALLPLVNDQLRALAGRRMRQEPPDQTLQATALVHEAYLRLVGGAEVQLWAQAAGSYSPVPSHRPSSPGRPRLPI